MNTLNLIKKANREGICLHDAQITHTSYRGVEYTYAKMVRKYMVLSLSWSYVK